LQMLNRSRQIPKEKTGQLPLVRVVLKRRENISRKDQEMPKKMKRIAVGRKKIENEREKRVIGTGIITKIIIEGIERGSMEGTRIIIEIIIIIEIGRETEIVIEKGRGKETDKKKEIDIKQIKIAEVIVRKGKSPSNLLLELRIG
jgi:hypothetical protein